MRSGILAFAVGVWLLQQQGQLPSLFWGAFLPVIAAGWLCLRGEGAVLRYARAALVCALALGSGFFWADWCAQQRLADRLPETWEGRDVELTGVISTLPQRGEFGTQFGFAVEQIHTADAIVPTQVALTWYSRGSTAGTPQLHAGERWKVSVRLKKPHGNANPHGFDYEAWLLERGVRATGYVREREPHARVSRLVWRPGYLIERLRERVRDRFVRTLQEAPYQNVLIALAVGDQSGIAQRDWRIFWNTGVGHLISISGLHVTMISALAFAIAYFVWRLNVRWTLFLPARKAAVIAGVIAATGYALLAGFSVPTQRTVYMLAVFALALWQDRLASPSRVLCSALLLVLVLDPWAVLAPGFWLSFGAVALIFFASAQRIGTQHPLRRALVAQLAVTLGLIPLLMAMFQQVSLISPVANAIAIPVVSFAVVPLCLLGALPGCEPLLWLAHGVFAWCMRGLELLNGVPQAVWVSHASAPWALIFAALGVLWVLLPRGFPARWLGAVLLLPLVVNPPQTPVAGAWWLTVLDVGQGLAVVVRTQNHALLYDAGPGFSSEADSGNRIILPYLRAAGVRHLDGMILSHQDLDHSGGAVSVLDALPVGWLASSLSAAHPILAHARQSLPCFAGQSWTWDGVRFDVLHPGATLLKAGYVKSNNIGCVLKVSSAFGSALLTADIEAEVERDLSADERGALKADVLLVPHHGSKTSSSAELLDAVAPAVAVIPVGYRSRFGHPKAEVVERYLRRGIALYRSDRDGAVTLRFEPAGIGTEAYRARFPRYWYGS